MPRILSEQTTLIMLPTTSCACAGGDVAPGVGEARTCEGTGPRCILTPLIGGNIAVEWRQWRGNAVLTGQDKDVWAATVQAVGDDDLAHASPASAGEALLAGDMHS